MAVITMSTVGFGDKLPLTTLGKVFATAWMLVGAGATLNFVTELAQASRNRRLRRKLDDSAHQLFNEMDGPDGNGKVTLAEFMRFVLVTRSLVSQEVVDEIMSSFKTLDENDSGDLDLDELKKFSPSPSQWDEWTRQRSPHSPAPPEPECRLAITPPQSKGAEPTAAYKVAELSAVLYEVAQGLGGLPNAADLPLCVDTGGKVDLAQVAAQLEDVNHALRALITDR
mmetsp:Transcript_16141/g.41142  ORF Transcript_16141/g.41142 Transcript_16141/m.41142 type:complete len:226 (-) Transcript_16141:270-947(-)